MWCRDQVVLRPPSHEVTNVTDGSDPIENRLNRLNIRKETPTQSVTSTPLKSCKEKLKGMSSTNVEFNQKWVLYLSLNFNSYNLSRETSKQQQESSKKAAFAGPACEGMRPQGSLCLGICFARFRSTSYGIQTLRSSHSHRTTKTTQRWQRPWQFMSYIPCLCLYLSIFVYVPVYTRVSAVRHVATLPVSWRCVEGTTPATLQQGRSNRNSPHNGDWESTAFTNHFLLSHP